MNGSPRKKGPIEGPVNSFKFNPAIPALPHRKNRLELTEEWSILQETCMKITRFLGISLQIDIKSELVAG